MGNEHISFTTSKIGSLVDVQSSKDPEGLRIFYYLVQVSNTTFSSFINDIHQILVILPDLAYLTLIDCHFMLLQDLKCFVFSLISLHFKIKPI